MIFNGNSIDGPHAQHIDNETAGRSSNSRKCAKKFISRKNAKNSARWDVPGSCIVSSPEKS
jgi:hypothetical protein